jgi:GntR family transcriptional regulator
MAKREDTRLLSDRVAAELRARIMAGDLKPGDQLPSNSQLVEEFDASNPTIQRAVDALKSEGFLSSRRGKGVFVENRQPFIVDVSSYFAPSPGGYSYELLQVGREQPPGEVRDALGLPEASVALLRKRLLRHNDRPVELDWSFYPVEIAEGTALEAKAKIKGGAPRVLAELGHAETDMVDTISARMPTTEEVELLDLPGVPVIRQFRVIYGPAGEPVEASIMIKGAHLYQVRYRQPVS